MKKTILLLFLSFLFLTCVFASANKEKSDNQNIRIVCTMFPEYDWVSEILGDNPSHVNVTFLLNNGIDLHNYEPSIKDISDILNSNLFIYTGGESAKWVSDVLKVHEKKINSLNLMDVLGNLKKEEEIKEGMQEEANNKHENNQQKIAQNSSSQHIEHSKELEYDEHIWLSLKNAIVLCKEIEKRIEQIDSGNADLYKQNLNSYVDKLEKLDKEYYKKLSEKKHNVLLFGDRFPFRYLVDDYNIDYYAAFAGCSAETEASFKTISFLVSKVNNLNLDYILTIDGSDKKIAETIVKNSKTKNQNILTLHSIQSVSTDDIKNGKTYLNIMQDNLKILEKALN